MFRLDIAHDARRGTCKVKSNDGDAAFGSIGGRNWLQGRVLLGELARHGDEVDGVVVDLGCGRSPFRSYFSKARSFIRIDCFAVDPEVIVADASALPLDSGSVDCILLAQVIGDVADLVNLFREIDRVLAPTGRVLIYETMTYPQHDLPHDYWRVLPSGLKWSAEQAGLHVADIKMIGGYFTQIAMNWNIFLIGDLGGSALTRPIAWLLRAFGNITFAMIDTLVPRPNLASDYFACLVKAAPAAQPSSAS